MLGSDITHHRRVAQIFTFLNTDPTVGDFAAPSTSKSLNSAIKLDDDRLVLLYASSNYFVLYALHLAGVLSKAPHVRCAEQLLHRDNEIVMSNEYRLQPPIFFAP